METLELNIKTSILYRRLCCHIIIAKSRFLAFNPSTDYVNQHSKDKTKKKGIVKENYADHNNQWSCKTVKVG